MPTISVEKSDLYQLIGKTYPLEEFGALLSLVKGEMKGYNQETGELRIELNDTNRPDLWSPEGIARQLRFSLQEHTYDDLLHFCENRPEKTVLVDANLKTIRPYIGAFIAKGVVVTEQLGVSQAQRVAVVRG